MIFCICCTWVRYLCWDEDKNELLGPREKPSSERILERKNPKIKSERIDNLVRSRKRDTENYRKSYPGLPNEGTHSHNIRFYKNEISSNPDGDFIDKIHENWWADYRRLEIHHGYIQWLFPIREIGMNYQAKELQPHEAEEILSTPECRKRVLLSYKMMLDFYGLELVDADTGEIQRASNWKERFAHLNRSYHNYLRITRILKSLGELGFENLKFKYLEMMLREIIIEGTLPNCFDSCVSFWIMVVRDDQEREKLIKTAKFYCDIYNGVSDKMDESKGDDSGIENVSHSTSQSVKDDDKDTDQNDAHMSSDEDAGRM